MGNNFTRIFQHPKGLRVKLTAGCMTVTYNRCSHLKILAYPGFCP